MQKQRLLEYFQACLNATYVEGENGVSWAVEERGEDLFILFEASNGLSDWLNNVNFHAVPYREMRPVWQCHAGFLRAWKSAEADIADAVRGGEERGVCRVTVIGYSHGAALAVLCHEWVWYHCPRLREGLCGFGFGGPRVLYGCPPPAVARRWENFYLIRNIDDAVTHLPPRVMGYCHVGNLVEIGEAGRYSALDAHRPQSYLASLEE